MSDSPSRKPVKKPHDPKLEAVAGFLALDVLALVAFGFGGYTGLLVLRILGFFLAILLIPYLRYHLRNASHTVHPYLAYGSFFFLGISHFWLAFYGGNILYAILFNLLAVIGFVGFFMLGSAIKGLPKLRKEYLALALLGGLALLVIVTTIYSLSRYGFFYAAIYKGQVYYYDGVVFPVSSEGKFLDGFLFRETSLSYAMAPSFLLACSGVGLFALRPKDGWRFFALLGFAAIGILSLVLVPYFMGLILLIPVYLTFLIHYIILKAIPGEENKKKRRKIAKVIFIVLVVLAALLVITLFADTFLGENGPLKKIPLFYANGSPRRLGSYIDSIESALSAAMFKTSGGVRTIDYGTMLFGAAPSEVTLSAINQPIFEFSVFYQNGLVGFVGLMILIFFGLYHGWHFIEEDEDLICRKMALVGILLGVFIYFSFVNDENPLLHAYHLDEMFSYHNSILTPFTRSGYALLAIFLLGYVYTPRRVEEAEIAAEPAPISEKTEEEVASHE